jgi:hypothetical protein
MKIAYNTANRTIVDLEALPMPSFQEKTMPVDDVDIDMTLSSWWDDDDALSEVIMTMLKYPSPPRHSHNRPPP